MTSFIHQNFQGKILPSACRSISSFAVIENSTNFHGTRDTVLPPFPPLHFSSNYTKSGRCTLRNTKILHAHLLKTSILPSDTFITNSLMDWYCKSTSMVHALRLFDKTPQRNLVSWNTLISGCNENFLFQDSWSYFCKMRFSGFDPNQFTYGSVLSACTALGSPLYGKLVYSLAMKNGFFSNGYVRAGMIDLLSKLCSFGDALRVFQDVLCDNVVCWNSIISGAVKNMENWTALYLFCQMCSRLLRPNNFTFSIILTACAALEELEFGKAVQGWVIKYGAGEDIFVGTATIDFYAKCRDMDQALMEFLRMPIRNVVSWTAIISGFVQKDDSISAFHFFKEMRKVGEKINNYTITSVLTACTEPAMIKEAVQLHSWIFKTGFNLDSTVSSTLINMYSKIGAVNLSERVFREMKSTTTLAMWAVMISAFAQNGSTGKVVELFQRMLQEGLRPDKFCSSSVLSIVDSLGLGRQIHCYILKIGLFPDISVGSSLFTMYSKCGSLEESYTVFEQMPDKDNVSWASMIAGFSEHGQAKKAVQLFKEMLLEEIRPDQMTLTAALTACSALHSLRKGKEVHGYALRAQVGKEVLVGGALVSMYSKCGVLVLARRVFDMLPQKDKFSCSSLVSGYAQNGHIEDALLLFHEIRMADLWIDSFTVSSVIGAVAILNILDIGTQLHAYVTKMGLDTEVSVGSSLVTMYSKCGSIGECHKVFEHIEKPDLISWTAMIVSYAQHGKGADALKVYDLMRKEGIKPDSVTFVGVLSACSHNGMVEEGYFHLNSMAKEYGIEPGYYHYACMVDLLGRSGRLKEAERFINNMPIEPDALIWGILLAACKVHGDTELGRLAANRVIELEPCGAGAYVTLSNICADMGWWEDVLKIRSLMEGTGVRKEPGWSSV